MTHLPSAPSTTGRRIVRKVFGLVSLVAAGVIVTWMYTAEEVKKRTRPAEPVELQGELLDAPAPEEIATQSVVSAVESEAQAAGAPLMENVDPSDPAYDWKTRPVGKGGNILITLEELGGFRYEPPLTPDEVASDDEATTPRIPAKFEALDGMTIATYGYMIPIDLEGNTIREFILVNNLLACCFGVMPEMNQWLHVTLAKGTTEYMANEPILVIGKMDVGERWEHDMVISLYRMEAETVRPLDQ